MPVATRATVTADDPTLAPAEGSSGMVAEGQFFYNDPSDSKPSTEPKTPKHENIIIPPPPMSAAAMSAASAKLRVDLEAAVSKISDESAGLRKVVVRLTDEYAELRKDYELQRKQLAEFQRRAEDMWTQDAARFESLFKMGYNGGDKLAKLTMPSSDEMVQIITSLAPAKMAMWDKDLRTFLKPFNKDIAMIIDVAKGDWPIVLAEAPELVAPNELLARILRAAFESKASRVITFRAEQPESVMTCGNSLYHAIKDSAIMSSHGEQTEATMAYESKFYYILGSDTDKVKEQALDLTSDFKLTKAYKLGGDIAVLHALIEKMPDSLMTKREELLEKLVEGEAMGKVPWTQGQLITIIAIAVKKGATSAAIVTPSTAAADAGRDKKVMVCVNCGSPDHDFRQCKKTCKECKLPFCPTVWAGGTCPCTLDTLPANDMIKNAIPYPDKKPIPEYLYERMADRHCRLKSLQSVRPTTAAAVAGTQGTQGTQTQVVRADGSVVVQAAPGAWGPLGITTL